MNKILVCVLFCVLLFGCASPSGDVTTGVGWSSLPKWFQDAKMDMDIKTQEQAEKIDKRLLGIDMDLEAKGNQIKGLEMTVGDVNSRVGTFEAKVGSLTSRLGTIELTVGNMDTTMKGIEAKLITMNTQIGDINASGGGIYLTIVALAIIVVIAIVVIIIVNKLFLDKTATQLGKTIESGFNRALVSSKKA